MNWYMTFSTESHGFSLNQLFRRSVEFDHDSPSLLIIKDVEQNVSESPKIFLNIFSDYLDIRCLYTSSANDK